MSTHCNGVFLCGWLTVWLLEPCVVSPAPRGTRDTASHGIPQDSSRTFMRDGAGAGLSDFIAEWDPAKERSGMRNEVG